MLGKMAALVVLCLFSTVISAVTNQEILNNLHSRIVPLDNERSLIKSFSEHTQSYVYDQALAIITFAKSGDRKTSAKLLRGLSSVQLTDGSLYFSYNLDGTSIYPVEGDRRFAGAIAWVALAATHYQAEFQSQEFVSFNLKLLTWLRSQMTEGPLKFNPTDVASTKWKENETAALEHNLDAYAAFTHFAKLNPDYGWKLEIASLQKFVLSLWDKNRGHFWSGADIVSGKINREELYLDNQTWSLLALDFDSLKQINVNEALALNCESLYVEHAGVSGFVDSKPVNGPMKHEFVWSEGTLGQVLAMNKAGFQCAKKDFIAEVNKMKKADGGIAYATSATNPDFTTSSSVAGTAWMYFASNGINPFTVIPVRSVAAQTEKTSRHVP